MAGKNLGSASYKLALDASQWKEGAVLTRKETALLRQAWRETETPAERLQSKIHEVEAAMQKLAAGSPAAETAGRYLGKLRKEMEDLNRTPAKGLNLGNLKGDMANLGRDVTSGIPGVGRFASMLGSVHPAAIAGAAGVAAFGAAVYGIKSAVSAGLEDIDRLGKASERTGFDMQSFVGLDLAGGLSDIQDVPAALQKFTESVGMLEVGNAKAVKTFGMLGLSAKDMEGMLPVDRLRLVADRFTEVESEAQRAAIAQKLFGGEGGNMALLLASGAAGIDDAINRAKELGLVVSDVDSKAVQAANDAMTELSSVFRGVSMQLASELAPEIETATELITDFLTSDQGKATVGLFIDAVDLGLKSVVYVAGKAKADFDKIVAAFLAGEIAAREFYRGLLDIRRGWNELTGDTAEADALTAQINEQRNAVAALRGEFDKNASSSAQTYYDDFTAKVNENRAAHEQAAGARRDFAAAGLAGDLEGDAQGVDKLSKSLGDYAAKLREQLNTFGMTGRAAEIAKLAREGASGTDLQDVQALDRQLSERELAKTVQEQTAAYAKQADELAGVKRAKSDLLSAQIAEYKAMGATETQLAGLRNAYEAIVAAEQKAAQKETANKAEKEAEKQRKALEKVNQEREKLFKDAASAVQGIDPEAKFRDSVQEMLKWLEAGAIDMQQFAKLKDEAAKSLEKPVKIKVDASGIEGAAAGTMEAAKRIDQIKAERAARLEQEAADTKKRRRADAIVADEAQKIQQAKVVHVQQRQAAAEQREWSKYAAGAALAPIKRTESLPVSYTPTASLANQPDVAALPLGPAERQESLGVTYSPDASLAGQPDFAGLTLSEAERRESLAVRYKPATSLASQPDVAALALGPAERREPLAVTYTPAATLTGQPDVAGLPIGPVRRQESLPVGYSPDATIVKQPDVSGLALQPAERAELLGVSYTPTPTLAAQPDIGSLPLTPDDVEQLLGVSYTPAPSLANQPDIAALPLPTGERQERLQIGYTPDASLFGQPDVAGLNLPPASRQDTLQVSYTPAPALAAQPDLGSLPLTPDDVEQFLGVSYTPAPKLATQPDMNALDLTAAARAEPLAVTYTPTADLSKQPDATGLSLNPASRQENLGVTYTPDVALASVPTPDLTRLEPINERLPVTYAPDVALGPFPGAEDLRPPKIDRAIVENLPVEYATLARVAKDTDIASLRPAPIERPLHETLPVDYDPVARLTRNIDLEPLLAQQTKRATLRPAIDVDPYAKSRQAMSETSPKPLQVAAEQAKRDFGQEHTDLLRRVADALDRMAGHSLVIEEVA